LSSGVASDPKDGKSFPSYEGRSFSKILYKFIYETEIVTFQKIRIIVKMLMLYFSEGGRKDKTDY
jgi:hypothetical protein